MRLGNRLINGLVAGTALLAAACQPQEGRVNLQSDEKIIISKSTWDYYQTSYLKDIDGGNRRGAFVVSEDGFYANYSYCPIAQGCFKNINYSYEAIKDCRSQGYNCVLFAKDADIVIPYDVAD